MKVVVLLLGIILLVNGHCYMTNPRSRGDQKNTQTGCRYGNDARRDIEWGGIDKRAPTCSGPCDKKVAEMGLVPPTAVARGDTITINWVRHYHSGGFIRFAWAPTVDSDSHAAFDNNIHFYMCKETGGCSAANEPADCGVTFTVPPHLTDGAWTLSWAYFGGEYNAGDYYSCVDYTVSGGPQGARPAVVFNGGDAWNVGGTQCRFYQTNQLHVCTLEPCTNGTIQGGPHMGVVAGFSTGSGSGTPTTGAPQTPTTGALTTRSPPVTTQSPPYTTQTPPYTTDVRIFTTQAPPRVTTQYSAPYNPPTGTTGVEGMQWCYKDGTPNTGGPINNPPTCGILAPNARCNDDQCCNAQGKCGPTKAPDGHYYEDVDGISQVVSQSFAFSLYCDDSTADYRKVPCSSSDVNQWSYILAMASALFAVYLIQ